MTLSSARTTGAVLGGILLLAVLLTVSIRYNSVERERNAAARALFAGAATSTYTDLEGNQLNLADQTEDSEVLVVTTWASWCPQCAAELSLINTVVSKSALPVKVLALNRREPKEQAARFLTTMPSLPHVTYVLDNDDHFFASVEGYAMPETLIYNERGEVVYHKRGNFTEDELRTTLAALEQNN